MNDHDLLLRIDERVQSIHDELSKFVTKKEFVPVKAIVFSATGIICTMVFLALMGLIIKTQAYV